MSETPTVTEEVNRQLSTGESANGGLLSMTMVARRLERQRDHYLRQSASLIGKLADMNIRRHIAESERDAYAETLRDLLNFAYEREREYIRERHPELAQEASKP